MQIILGFGCQEERERARVIEALDGLTDEKDIHMALRPWNEKAKEYDKMPRETAPERYTSISFYDGKLHFSHINRQHPFSPDGWALLQIDEQFSTPEADHAR